VLDGWAIDLDAEPEHVVSSTRSDFPWTNSHHIAGDLRVWRASTHGRNPGRGGSRPPVIPSDVGDPHAAVVASDGEHESQAVPAQG
jgi:hypothetical protein